MIGLLLLFVIAAGTLTESIRLLQEALRERPYTVSGTGWKTHSLEYLQEYCKILEQYLTDRKERPVPVLSGSGLMTQDWQKLLAEVDENELDEKDRLLYKKLNYYKDMIETEQSLPDYGALLSEFDGTLQRIREDYYVQCFETKEDINAYLEWLEAQAAVLDEMRESLKTQQLLSGFYSEESIEKARVLCGQLWGDQGLLNKGFEERLASCAFLSEREKEELSVRKEELMKGRMAEALQRLEEQIGFMQGAEYSSGLGSYPEGAAYYDYLLERNTGSGMNAGEMFEYLETARTERTYFVGTKPLGEEADSVGAGALAEEAGSAGTGALAEDVDSVEMGTLAEGADSAETGALAEENIGYIEGMSAERVMEELYRHTKETYPDMGNMAWELVELPDSFFGRVSKAFYVKRGEKNRIYISEAFSEEDWMTRYQVLAHEGFPGHACSYSRSGRSDFPFLEQALAFPGYEEGRAVRAELAAAEWLAEGQEQYKERILENLYHEIVLSQMDIGIHGLGWSMEELDDFAEKAYGEAGRGIGASLWNLLADNPCMYQSYTVGYLKLLELEEKYPGSGRDKQEFERRCLECGQAPFGLLEEWLQGEEDRNEGNGEARGRHGGGQNGTGGCYRLPCVPYDSGRKNEMVFSRRGGFGGCHVYFLREMVSGGHIRRGRRNPVCSHAQEPADGKAQESADPPV